MAGPAASHRSNKDITSHSVDKSGRITLKQVHRDDIGETAILTYGLRTSTRMFSPDKFEAYAEELLQYRDPIPFDPDWAEISLQLLDCKATCKIDSQGRLRIPPTFLHRAGLDTPGSAEVEIVYRPEHECWEIWPFGDAGKGHDPNDPFYQALVKVSERARTLQQSASQVTGGSDD